MATIDIAELDKAAILAALYNAALPLMQPEGQPTVMTVGHAEGFLKGLSKLDNQYIDFLGGRSIQWRHDEGGDTLNTYFYDRDNGEGAAEKAIAHLRETGEVRIPTEGPLFHTAREWLNKAADAALEVHEEHLPESAQAVKVFLDLVYEHPDTRWIGKDQFFAAPLMIASQGDRARFEYAMRGFRV